MTRTFLTQSNAGAARVSLVLAGALAISGCLSSNYAPVVYHDADPQRPGQALTSAADPSVEPAGGVTGSVQSSALAAPPVTIVDSPALSSNSYPEPLAPPVTASAPIAAPAPVPLATAEMIKPYQIVVQQGDTLFSLSRAHQVDRLALASANGLREPFALRPGQKLTVPAERVHVVGHGDTLYAIARAHRVSVDSLARMNNLGAPYALRLGQSLRLPASGEYGTLVAAKPPSTGVGGPLVQMGQSPAPPADRPQADLQMAASVHGFSWPARGKLLSGFGPKESGRRNDGVNILVADGAPVYAAKAGEVVYTGNEIKGYGNLILIRHENGYVTAYAHNRRVLVKRGESVRRGQHIAEAGQTGGVDRPQVHFEIRKNREPVDPATYLPSI